MKIFLHFSLLIIVFNFYSCRKQEVAPSAANEKQALTRTNQPTAENTASLILNPLNRTVGNLVDTKTANSWVGNYNKSRVKAGMGGISYFPMPLKDITTAVNRPYCIGFALCYAKYNNQIVMLAIPVNDKGQQMKMDYINTPYGLIAWERAKQWIANYRGTLKAHFWGIDGLNKFKAQYPNCINTRIYFGIDDKGQQQAMISDEVYNYIQKPLDESTPCPPICPK